VETDAQRAERIARLEEGRAERRGDLFNHPVEVAPGRGDLTRTSSTWLGDGELFPQELLLVDNHTVSYTRLFQTQPWVAAAVMRMLTWAVRVPLKVYRRTGDDSRVRLREDEHPLAAAVISPWERGHQAGLVMNLLGPMLVHGNSLTEVEEGASGQIQFGPRDWRFSQPIRPWRDSLEGFKVDTDSAQFAREVSIDYMIHVAWWSPVGNLGTSPLQQLGVTLSIEDGAQRYQRGLFKNGARPPSAVTASEAFLGLEKPERQIIMRQLRKDITELYTGPENAGRPALLPPGLDWKPVGHSAVEAELIDQRKIVRDEIAAVYLIPPPMMGILDKATYSNIETQREMIYTECLGPPLVLIEQCINAQVVRGLLRETDVYCEFDFAGVLRGDRLKEIQSLREAIGSALLTPNEGRSKINEPRSDDPGMDTFYIPGNNLVPVGTPARPPVTVSTPSQGASSHRRLHVRSKDADFELEFR
jgi:HK97 family phage portal protein